MLEKLLIMHCAPTLAGIKTGNLFHCTFSSEDELRLAVRDGNDKLNGKGIYLEILRIRGGGALILAYRPAGLGRDLRRKGVDVFLGGLGYGNMEITYAMAKLKERLSEHDGFPHEIGLFLGYPLDDVIGFIENEGHNSKCAGCWKVYRDEQEAVKRFNRYKKCREIYLRMFSKGCSIMQLSVAA